MLILGKLMRTELVYNGTLTKTEKSHDIDKRNKKQLFLLKRNPVRKTVYMRIFVIVS